ncbi:MAG: ABC transporter ATP-binding protein [Sandaracinaceae bacterium]
MIVVDRVSKYYGEHPAALELDFRIEEGECVGFLGLNGAGKSTTLRMLSCLLLPTSGRISVGGFDVESAPEEIRKLIGYLPDTPPLYPEMRVDEFLLFAGRLRRMSKADAKQRLPEVLEVTGLTDVRRQPIATLSHGYRQRVGIAQAIIHRPALLILDEPIQGLDPVQIVEMRELIRGLRGEHTILLSSHILSEIERTCDRILMLHRGRIVAQGTEEELVGRTLGGAVEGATWLQLEVRGDADALRAALEGPGIEVSDVVSLGDDRVQAKIEVLAAHREDVARRIVEGGLGLLELKRTQSALEDAFVRLSRDEEEA